MKLAKYLIGILSLVLLLSLSGFAQDEEMTVEEWEAEMTRLAGKKTALIAEIEALNADLDNLNATLSGLQDPEECIDELYAIVGATRQDVDNFRKAVNELDGKDQKKRRTKN